MFNAFAKVTTGVDKTNDFKKLIDELAKKQVYVGVPEGGNDRPADSGNEEADITNAELLYVHTHGIRKKKMRDEMNPKVESGEMTYSAAYELYIQSHGSPLWQAPPRPVIEPAIEHNKEAIAKQLQKVATTALDGQDPTDELEKAGMLGQNIARDWFTNPENNWAPNSPITINGSKPDKNGNQFIKGKGSEQPLINTGELRKSITYVISDGK
jgi:hypothetical protein